jgi:hypothetical protein
MNLDDITQTVQAQIFEITGKPKGFTFTKLTKVSDHCYRVNIYCTANANVINAMNICESYFITIDEYGTIKESTPTIQKTLKVQ